MIVAEISVICFVHVTLEASRAFHVCCRAILPTPIFRERGRLQRIGSHVSSRSQPAKPFVVGLPPRLEAVDAFPGAKRRAPAVVADKPEPSAAYRAAPS